MMMFIRSVEEKVGTIVHSHQVPLRLMKVFSNNEPLHEVSLRKE